MEDEHFDYIDFTDDVMDSETISQDFDDIDLYGTKMVEDDDDNCDIAFE